MKNARILLALPLAALLLGACGESPTSPARAGAPRLDAGGHGFGSGSRISPADSTNTSALSVVEQLPAGTTNLGGGFGSGN